MGKGAKHFARVVIGELRLHCLAPSWSLLMCFCAFLAGRMLAQSLLVFLSPLVHDYFSSQSGRGWISLRNLMNLLVCSCHLGMKYFDSDYKLHNQFSTHVFKWLPHLFYNLDLFSSSALLFLDLLSSQHGVLREGALNLETKNVCGIWSVSLNIHQP